MQPALSGGVLFSISLACFDHASAGVENVLAFEKCACLTMAHSPPLPGICGPFITFSQTFLKQPFLASFGVRGKLSSCVCPCFSRVRLFCQECYLYRAVMLNFLLLLCPYIFLSSERSVYIIPCVSPFFCYIIITSAVCLH